MKNIYEVIRRPLITEKAAIQKETQHTVCFEVHRDATKPEIKKAVEMLYDVKVAKVNTRITKEGKHATVKFAKGYKAEDIATRIGVF